MTLAKRRNVVNIFLICFYEMFYRNFLSLNVLKTASFSLLQEQWKYREFNLSLWYPQSYIIPLQ